MFDHEPILTDASQYCDTDSDGHRLDSPVGPAEVDIDTAAISVAAPRWAKGGACANVKNRENLHLLLPASPAAGASGWLAPAARHRCWFGVAKGSPPDGPANPSTRRPELAETSAVWTDAVRVVTDLGEAEWIRRRVTGPLGHADGTVPTIYGTYARILHPVGDGPNRSTTWADVAQVTGRRVHPTVQWHALISAPDPARRDAPLWHDTSPELGNLSLKPLLALCDILSRHTATPQDCFFALWEGWGWVRGGRAFVRFTADDGPGEPVPSAFTAAEVAAPRLHLPYRDYLVLRGPLSAMTELVQYAGPETWVTQSPSLFWPVDRSWCVATEIDFDSTLVGGSDAAIADVLAHPVLEAWALGGHESLMPFADEINL